MPGIAVSSGRAGVLCVPARERSRIEHLERDIVGNLYRGGMMATGELRAAGMHQLFQQGRSIVLGGVDECPAGRVPAGAFQRCSTAVEDGIPALDQAVNGWQCSATLNRQAVLQLPEQRFDPAGTEIGGRQVPRRLILQLGVGGGEEPLSVVR